MDIDKIQRERLARRLKAVYICEMTGNASVDKIFRELKKYQTDGAWLQLADLVLPIFHDIFLAQTAGSPRPPNTAKLIEFESLDPKKSKRH